MSIPAEWSLVLARTSSARFEKLWASLPDRQVRASQRVIAFPGMR